MNTKTKQTWLKIFKRRLLRKIPHTMIIHDDTRIDNYYWMRDDNRADPEIIAHLSAENAYTDVVSHTQKHYSNN
ncbi:hypothetical protein [Photobacterium leiognathi]|uniref:hypothetical protein n=1 Tax=Photobacterium leiognathi TaxID=553611 RepID=UPI003F740E00